MNGIHLTRCQHLPKESNLQLLREHLQQCVFVLPHLFGIVIVPVSSQTAKSVPDSTENSSWNGLKERPRDGSAIQEMLEVSETLC